jgi:hypothetical protein
MPNSKKKLTATRRWELSGGKKHDRKWVTVHTPWQPTSFYRVSTADKVAPKGVFSTELCFETRKRLLAVRGEVNDYESGTFFLL